MATASRGQGAPHSARACPESDITLRVFAGLRVLHRRTHQSLLFGSPETISASRSSWLPSRQICSRPSSIAAGQRSSLIQKFFLWSGTVPDQAALNSCSFLDSFDSASTRLHTTWVRRRTDTSSGNNHVKERVPLLRRGHSAVQGSVDRRDVHGFARRKQSPAGVLEETLLAYGAGRSVAGDDDATTQARLSRTAVAGLRQVARWSSVTTGRTWFSDHDGSPSPPADRP